MPRCELTKAAVERIRNTQHIRRTVYLDADVRSLLLEYRPCGTGTWYFRVRDGQGKFRMIRLGALGEMDVMEAKMQAYELQKRAGRIGTQVSAGPGQGAGMTFREFIEKHYLPHARTRKRSWKAEAGLLRCYIMPHFAEVRLTSVTRFSLALWQESLREKGLAASTCNRVLFLLKYAFNCARHWGFITESPARDVQALPEKEFRERYLSEDEARRLLEALAADKDRQAAQAVRLLLFTGARKSEVLAARWENVDMARRILTVPLSKSGRVRHIPLSDAALKVLHELPRGSAWLFPGPKMTAPITSIYASWDRMRTRAGLKDVRLHDLRHSFASFLVNSGCSLYEVQKILGHQTPRMTARYAHLAQDSLLRAANIVGEKFCEAEEFSISSPVGNLDQII